MEIEKLLQAGISKAFKELFDHPLPAEEIKLLPTRKEFPGSHTLVTFPYSRISRKSPEATAQTIGEYLVSNTEIVQTFNVVKGFLNLEIADKVWLQLLEDIIRTDKTGLPYGFQPRGGSPANGQKVMVEFSSPNTNKPLHLGHLRNNFLGDAVSRILEASGYTVQRVNIVNDRGIHICKSMLAYERFGNNETPASSGIKGDHLVGKYYVKFDQAYKKEIEALTSQGMDEETAKKEAPLIKAAQDMLQKWEQGDAAVVALWQKLNGWVYEGFDATYQRIGVHFDKIYHESDTYLLGKDIVEEGVQKGVFYRKEDGSVWVDLSDEGLDEKLVLRADGTSVYITQDLGTADMRHHDFDFDKCIYVVGNEQDYHFNVLFKILKRLNRKYADGLYHLSYGMVDLPSGKMKSREGTVVDADDLIGEMIDTARIHTEELGKIEGFSEEQAHALYEVLGIGALKYFLLKVDPKKRMLFNPEESVQFQGNTAPFIQYTHARIAAILRKAEKMNTVRPGRRSAANRPDDEEPRAIDLSGKYSDITTARRSVLHSTEREVIRILSEFPQKITLAAEEYAPSVIAQYVYDLAKEYNRFYAEVPIFAEPDQQLLQFRVGFSAVVASTIKQGMGLLGIQVPERM